MITSSEVIGELRGLALRHGGSITAAAVVGAARSPESALHDYFDWDDTEAGQKWRLHQARLLIKVTVEHIGTDEASPCARVFVSLRGDRHAGVGYRVLADVLSSSELRRQLLAEALADMESFKQKYLHLKELAEVFKVMRTVKRRIGGKARRVRASLSMLEQGKAGKARLVAASPGTSRHGKAGMAGKVG